MLREGKISEACHYAGFPTQIQLSVKFPNNEQSTATLFALDVVRHGTKSATQRDNPRHLYPRTSQTQQRGTNLTLSSLPQNSTAPHILCCRYVCKLKESIKSNHLTKPNVLFVPQQVAPAISHQRAMSWRTALHTRRHEHRIQQNQSVPRGAAAAGMKG